MSSLWENIRLRASQPIKAHDFIGSDLYHIIIILNNVLPNKKTGGKKTLCCHNSCCFYCCNTMIASVSFVLTGNLISNFPQTGEISNFSDNMSENTPSMRKKPAVRTAGGICQDGVLMATMRCARRHVRGHQLLLHRVGLLIVSILCPWAHNTP